MTTTTSTSTSQVNTLGTTTYVTGTASGLDTETIITAAVAERTKPADTLDAQVTANKTKIAAYQQLQTLVNALSTSMSNLASKTYSSVASSSTDFQTKTATVTASDASTASNYLTASATSSAVSASYSVTVDQLAAAEAVASNGFAQSTALGYAGSFSLQEADGTAQEIAVTADMTLSDIASAVNDVSSTTGVSASLVKTSDGTYRLVLSANDSNQQITAAAASGDDVLSELGLTDGTGFSNVLQAAQPALVTIAGEQISSDTNEVSDAISGVTLSLAATTPSGTTLTVAVKPDVSAVETDLSSFVDAYNSLRSYVTQNQTVGSDGTVDSSTAPLFADSLLTGASQLLNSLISTPASSATGDYSTLADLGITISSDNTLSISDSSTLESALSSNLSQAASMFQSSFTPSNTSLKLLANTSTRAFDFTLDVTMDANGDPSGVSVNGDTSAFTIQGTRIVGASGGPYAGLSFALHASSDQSVHVSIKPGLANQIVNLATQYAGSTGFIQKQIAVLTAQDTAWTTQSAQIRSDAADYQTKLVKKYAAMEQEVAAAQVVQAQIKALLDGQSSSS